MKKPIRLGLIFLVLVLAVIQLIPVKQHNPPGEPRLTVPAEARAVLERSCFDCHSNETNWPWYSRVAPGSWRISADVNEARKHLNFSDWDNIPAARRSHMKQEIWEEVEEGEMPLKSYLALHPDAKLTAADREVIRRWALGDAETAPEEEHH